MGYEFDFSVVLRRWDLLAWGLLNALKLTLAATAIAMPLGLLFAVGRMAPFRALSMLAGAYIDFFRTASALVLILWFFFAFPILIGLDLDAFSAATLAIALQAGAYYAEIYRSGLQAVPRGQWDGAQAIGLSTAGAMRDVILPQALRHMLPVIVLRLIDTLKISSLASAISYAELTYNASRVASDTFRPIETFTVVAAVYFVVIFAAGRAALALERSFALAKR